MVPRRLNKRLQAILTKQPIANVAWSSSLQINLNNSGESLPTMKNELKAISLC
jgi:hypothetical protein